MSPSLSTTLPLEREPRSAEPGVADQPNYPRPFLGPVSDQSHHPGSDDRSLSLVKDYSGKAMLSRPGVARNRGGERSQPEIDRHDRVRRLLDEVASCTDPARRKTLQSRVVLEHQSVARSIAARYRGRGVERGDLEQLAYLGLVKAALRWEPGRSEDFLQFAVPTIAGEIKRYFRDHSFMVRPPRRIQELRAAMTAPDASLTDRPLAQRSDAEVSARLGVDEGSVREARQASALCRPRSLDAPGLSGQSLSSTWGQEDGRLAHVEERLTVAALLDQLTERERTVIRMRFVEGLSQSRIGEEIGVSQMQVSRLLRGISAKLRTLIEP